MTKVVNPKIRLRNRVDYYFKEFIKLRDEGKQCVSCEHCPERRIVGKKGQNYLVACHYIWTGNYYWRRDERNCHAGCVACNRRAEEHKRRYTIFMIDQYGLETVRAMDSRHARFQDISTEELRFLKKHRQNKCQLLRKERSD